MYAYNHAAAVTPGSGFLNPPCSAFVVGTSGNVTFNVLLDNSQLGNTTPQYSSQLPAGSTGPQIGPAGSYDSTAVTIYCIAGFIYPIKCCKITSAPSGIVALW